MGLVLAQKQFESKNNQETALFQNLFEIVNNYIIRYKQHHAVSRGM